MNDVGEIDRLKILLWDTQRKDVSDIQFWKERYQKLHDKWLLEWTAHSILKEKVGIWPWGWKNS